MRNGEGGFMLLEAILSLVVLLAAAGALLLLARSWLVLEEDAARAQAVYLSQGVIAEAEARAAAGELAAGDVLAVQTKENGISFAGEAEAEPYRTGLYLVTAHVAWEGRTGSGEVRFERLVLAGP